MIRPYPMICLTFILITSSVAIGQENSRRFEEIRRFKAPEARQCHPREEHLLPLMVVTGAGGDDPGDVPFRDIIYGAHTLGVQFG